MRWVVVPLGGHKVDIHRFKTRKEEQAFLEKLRQGDRYEPGEIIDARKLPRNEKRLEMYYEGKPL